MFDALTYQEMLKEIKKNSEKYGITDDVVAILITRPDLATGKDIVKGRCSYINESKLLFIKCKRWCTGAVVYPI